MNDTDAYNGTGLDIYLNKDTSFDTFVHELGHARDSNRGAMDINSYKLNEIGFSGDWTKIKDEQSADNFARSVIGSSYKGYKFTEQDKTNYATAIRILEEL